MEGLVSLLRIIYVILFFIAVFIYLTFEWGAEGKDERGQKISNTSYSIVFPFFLIGWLFIELVNDFVTPINYETYKLLIWFLITGGIMIHAINISVMKRMY